jgi:gas vesicle protein
MSKLLEKWAQEKQLASDTLQDCRRKVSALQAECQRAPETLKQVVEKAQKEGNKFSLTEKRVYTEEARQLCWVSV